MSRPYVEGLGFNGYPLVSLAAALLVLILAGCQPGAGSDNAAGDALAEAVAAAAIEATSDSAATPWTSLSAQDAPEDFHFVVVTDRTGGARQGVFASSMPKVNLLAPAFVVSVGDLIEGYTENLDQLNTEWDEMEGFIGQLEAPFFYVAGNHDMNNEVMANEWLRRFGPSFYHFEYKDVLFVVLNSELFGMVGAQDTPVPGPWTQAQQMAFVEQVLADNTDARWTVVLVHQPLWEYDNINPDWLRVEELLGNRPYTVFAGHFHRYAKHRRNDRNFITLATTGGGSGLRGPVFGEFDHVAWVTMSEDGPQIANVMLDGIFDEDVSTRAMQARATALVQGLVAEPVLGSGASFEQGQQNVRITNSSQAPLGVTPSVLVPGNFEMSGLAPVTLEPGETRTLTLDLQVPEATPYRALTPALTRWMLTGMIDGQAIQTPVQLSVLPLTRLPISRPTASPTIDGSLDDWPELAYVVDQQGDLLAPSVAAEDLSYRFDVAMDDAALYVAVAVRDDEVVELPNYLAREQDAITLAVDVRDDAARNASMSVGEAALGGDMAQMSMSMLSLGSSKPDRVLAFLAESEKHIERAVQRTDEGYSAEFRIPVAHLDERAGHSDWQNLRISVAVYDRDEGDAAPVYVQWHPYRYGAAPLPWSHTFARP